MKKFVGDFETSAWLESETYVWAWALCEIGKEENIQIGNNIETFFDALRKEQNPVVYMHNLTFDRRIYCLLSFKKWF